MGWTLALPSVQATCSQQPIVMRCHWIPRLSVLVHLQFFNTALTDSDKLTNGLVGKLGRFSLAGSGSGETNSG